MSEPVQTTEWLTVPDLVELLGLSVSRVRRLIEDRHLAAKRIDGVLKVPAVFLKDGQPLSEPYLERDTPCEGRFSYCDLVVPAGALFVMGDNRPDSSDSRDWGALSLERVVGKAGIVYWPPRDWSVLQHAPAR